MPYSSLGIVVTLLKNFGNLQNFIVLNQYKILLILFVINFFAAEAGIILVYFQT